MIRAYGFPGGIVGGAVLSVGRHTRQHYAHSNQAGQNNGRVHVDLLRHRLMRYGIRPNG